MDVLEGKVAVVTGAASGIGRALARAWAVEGMRVVMADVEAPALAGAAADLRAAGAEVLEVVTDVRDPTQVEALAARTVAAYGAVHVACNNAGVARSGLSMWDAPLAVWDWTLGVNLWGVIHGVRAFVPRMIAQGEGHIVNTASLAGLSASGILGPYAVSKYAVVGLSEELYQNLRLLGAPVGVSVLCPGPVNTGIATAERNGPEELRATPLDPGAAMIHDVLARMLLDGLEPDEVAGAVVEAVKAGRLYVVADRGEEWKAAVRGRADDIVSMRNPAPPPAAAGAATPLDTVARSHEFTQGLYGWITHTDLASSDPVATRDWCAAVLGWTFQPPFRTPSGEYHLFAYSDSGGGGVRHTADDELPGSTPTVHVRDTQAAYDAALAAGAEAIRPPTKVMDGVCTAMVRAPGGVLIGFSGPTP